MTALPVVSDFDAATVPAWSLIRSLPAEARGVAHSLLDALKASRMVALRSGTHVLTDAEIAAFICERPDVLGRALPVIVQWGFAARDDEGALYSPHLLLRARRRQEKACHDAERAANAAQFEAAQAAGQIPPGETLRGYQARINGRMGGRTRKGETPEQARARRQQAADEAARQRNLTLLRSVPNAETENPNQKPKPVSVSAGSVSGPVPSVSLDIDTDNNIPSSVSESGETELAKPAATVATDILNRTVVRVMEVAGFERDTIGRHIGMVRKWLQEGIPEPVIVQAARDLTGEMRGKGQFPRHAGVFDSPVRAAWAQQQIAEQLPEQTAERGMPAWEAQARTDLAADHRAFAAIMQREGDYGHARKLWVEEAARLGRPTVKLNLTDYLEAYRPQEAAA